MWGERSTVLSALQLTGWPRKRDRINCNGKKMVLFQNFKEHYCNTLAVFCLKAFYFNKVYSGRIYNLEWTFG